MRSYFSFRVLSRFCINFALRILLWFALLLSAWWAAGAVLQFPSSTPVESDMIVMLGGGDGDRYFLCKSLVQSGFASHLLLINPRPSDVEDVVKLSGAVQVYRDTASQNSWDEAINTRRMMEDNGFHHVLVVSDPPHMLRLAYTWWSVFRGSGLDYTLVATSPPWWSAWRWWDNEQAAIFAGIEVFKLGYYVVRYRFGWGE